ncbi:hypothetical protein HDR59_04240 [bacterium]|nr:hypothetical protein [bacterium]
MFVVVVVSITLVGFLLDVLVANLFEEVVVVFLAEETAALFFDEVLFVAALLVFVGFFLAALTVLDKIEIVIKIENRIIV